MRLILFEDPCVRDFYPLTELRPVWELRTGLGTLRQRIEWRLGLEATGGLCRGPLQPVAARLGLPHPELEQGEDILMVNGRLLELDAEAILSLEPGQGMLQGEILLAARLAADGLADLDEGGPELDVVESPEGMCLAGRLWDLIHALPAAAAADFLLLEERLRQSGRSAPPENVDLSVRLMAAERIHIEAGAMIAPYCVIDAAAGPVVIERGARLAPFCVVEGPCLIGEDSRLKPGTRLLGGCHLGPGCRVGGEVAESILQGHANKQHDGFLGHAYLGEWTNLGADTNNSDLKNNYGPVTVRMLGRPVATGERFVGLMMGDHAKTGINTMFNTGTVVGVFANVWGGGFPPKEIPPFSWGGPQDGLAPYDLEKALATARTVKARRERRLEHDEEDLIRALHQRYGEDFPVLPGT
ncbi:MAG: putative sugar nucleotidyl transferase [bacterium]|jgi:UDP-N-acetylglucosamine diphosphorylase/glucosamine-1-phosphate N-acetyltransferase|nr:putative sugar nucleotidyl transferase [bacterium]